MPIRPPSLDDRSFDDLVAEMLRRIPAHTPEWTNPRVGDPGRTLIDLVAWLGDTILYRANLIPERQRLAFLSLLGLPMRPAQPARGLLAVALAEPTQTDAIDCKFRTVIEKPLHFETEQEVTVFPVIGQCYIKRDPTPEEKGQFKALLPDLIALYNQGSKQASPYITTPVFVDGEAEPDGRDVIVESVDKCLWVGLFAAQAGVSVVDIRKTLGADKDNRRRILNVGLAQALSVPDLFEDIGIRRRIPHRWEICSDVKGNEEPSYAKIDVDSDGTAGLTKAGIIRLLLPGINDFGSPSNDVTKALAAGVGDRPPRIDDAELASRLVTWIRLRPEASTALHSLRLAWVGINAVSIEQRETLGRRTLGQGSGSSDQEFSLGVGSVEPDSLVIDVSDETGTRTWRRVADTAAAKRDEPVYSLDSEAGVIRFGDGVRGRAPAFGSIVQVQSMRSGGGLAGNLQAGSIKDNLRDSKIKVKQPLATTGGADAEGLDDAEHRIPRLLRHQNRAVTETDYKEITLRTPGTAMGRVEILPRFKPHQTREDIPGVVSVMVFPRREDMERPSPRADRPLLETVHAWLDERRQLGTELYVISCDYVPLAVSVAVELRDRNQREATLKAVSDAVKSWLWALSPGGPDGTGWPLGRTVQDREIEVAVARVPGVATVATVNLFMKPDGKDAWLKVTPNDQDRAFLQMKSWQLPELLSVLVVEGSAAPNDVYASNSNSPANLVAIPVVPELC